MTCIVDNSELEQSCAFDGSHNFAIDLPGGKQLRPELFSLSEVDAIDPLHCPWVLYDQIVLSVIDENWDALIEQLLNQIDFVLHEVSIEGIVDLL